MTPTNVIEIKKESPLWDGHLFVDMDGKFGWNAGAWERPILEIESQRGGFAGFFRNIPRRRYSLCVPHGPSNDQPFYPDLLIFTRRKGRVKIDILEPHGDHLADHLSKAQGLARYALAHGNGNGKSLGRIEMIRIVKDKPERLNMQDEVVREKILKATTAEQLQDLYAELG